MFRRFTIRSPSAFRWCQALANITELKETQQLFGREEFRDSMIHVALYVVDKENADEWLKILHALTDNNESNKKLFLVDALKDEKERIEKIKQ